jgi:hypothetical protein
MGELHDLKAGKNFVSSCLRGKTFRIFETIYYQWPPPKTLPL